MKTWQFFTLAMALLMAGCSEAPTVTKKTDWENQGLEGNVKQLKLIHYYEFQIEGDSVVLIPDSTRIILVHRFNEVGKVMEIDYYTKGEMVRQQISMYDDKGNKHEVHSVNPDGSIREKGYYEFNIKGNIIKRTAFRSDVVFSVRDYTIDANGNTTEEIDYDPNGIINHRTITPYDENSNRTEYLFEVGGRKISWIKYRYDEMGNIVEYITLDSLGNVWSKTINKFDEKGNDIENHVTIGKAERTVYLNKHNEKGAIIEMIHYNSDNNINSIRKFDFSYDAKGNWIRRIISVNDSIILPIYVREIEYYE